MRVFALALVTFAVPAAADTALERFKTPDGVERVALTPGSFGDSLRHLPLAPAGTPVRRHDGGLAHAPWAQAVAALDVGARDLQQCADSAIRLYAEWRRVRGTERDLVIHATSGDPIPFARYARGDRATAKGRGLSWTASRAPADSDHWAAWLETVFLYAGSMSLARDTVAVTGPLLPGDLLVVGGSPGHVLVVLDVARPTAGDPDDAYLLVGQGFMPAQSFHVIGWVRPDADGVVSVPSWPRPFGRESRRRFR